MASRKERLAALAAFSGTTAGYRAQPFARAVQRSLRATRIEFAHLILRVPCNKELCCQLHESASRAFCRLDHSHGIPANAVRLSGWSLDPVRHPNNHPSVL